MLDTVLSRQLSSTWLRLTCAVAPLSLGAIVLTSVGMSAQALPLVIQPQSCGSYIYGNPIPAPVPVNPITGQPCALSSSTVVVTPGRGTIQNSTLIRPTIVNSTVSNSVLVNPVIINSPRVSRGVFVPSRVIYNPPGVRIRVGF